MKRIIIALIAFAALACGAPDEYLDAAGIEDSPCDTSIEGGCESGEQLDEMAAEGIEIGQTGQAIYMPLNYGMEGVSPNGPTCDNASNWDSGVCWVPDNKTLVFKFFASTCSSWWQARMVEAWNNLENYIDVQVGGEWEMTGALPGPNGPESVYAYSMRCQSTGGLASFAQDTSDTDTHSAQWGNLKQYRKGALKFDTADIEAQAAWINATDANRQICARNIIYHEFGHVFGFGHAPGVGDVVGSGGGCEFTPRFFTTSHRDRMRCYNEDSGTSDDC